MNSLKIITLAGVMAVTALVASTPKEADAYYRHYYTAWRYQPSYSYYYTTYYYKPITTYASYHYHYCIYYPTQPRYVYYYNPIRNVYWGRFDLEGKEGQQYSLLAPEDQKSDLNAIPESAFPAPGPMPNIPDSSDGVSITPPSNLPTTDTTAKK